MIAVPLVNRQLRGEILSVLYFVMSIKGNLHPLHGIVSTCKVITCEHKYFALQSKGSVGPKKQKILAKLASGILWLINVTHQM